MSLRQGLDLIAPAVQRTSRYSNPAVAYRDGHLSAYNGGVFARVPINLKIAGFCCDAANLDKVVDATSQILVSEQHVTVVTDGTKFHIKKLPLDKAREIPLIAGDSHRLSQDFIAGVGAVSPFASTNAMFPRTLGVVVTGDMVIATDNYALACSPMRTPFAVVLPSELIPRMVPGDRLIVGDHIVALCRPGGLTLQYQCLPGQTLAEVPAKILELAATLTACETPIKGLAAALKRFDRMQGVELIAFKPGRLVASCNYVRPDNRDAAEQPFECDFSFKAKIELVRLMVAAGATHVDASEAPERLRFSHDGETPLRGILAGLP